VQYETDRARFIGRTRSTANPGALSSDGPLGETVGTVLDAVFCLRTALDLKPGASAQIEVVTCAADTREELEAMLDGWSTPAPASAPREQAIAALGLPDAWLAGIHFEPFDEAWETEDRAPTLPRSRAPKGMLSSAFSADGAEYIIPVGASVEPTPQPWINVIANEDFGCLISETGAGYCWAANSRENRLTPWSNDAQTDPHTEALYVRDEESGDYWSMLPGPVPGAATYEAHHGFGYSRFTSRTPDVTQDACVFVPRHDPLRIVHVKLTNESERARRWSLFSYAQLVLGAKPSETRAAVVTSFDEASGIIYARNERRGEFSMRVAFAAAIAEPTPQQRAATGSRTSFLGRQGTVAAPAALARPELDARFGAGLDPCAALQLVVNVEPGQTLECAFILGEADSAEAARACVARYTTIEDVKSALAEIVAYWRGLLSAVNAQTPVPAFDLMLNGWLAYQNLACRMWARSAFYQSGGAFGFRDQLQDSSALYYLDPGLTREQILLHAAHQFVEGDVLHWWHPPTSKGIRTRFSDDLLWLPYIAQFYLARSGDRSILDEQVRYVTSQPLAPDDDEVFVWPEDSGETGSLYEHCCRALDRSLTRGAHGLPLMGVGDWNDGMNRVGREGRGESVWLGFFLFDILHDFVPVCDGRGDAARADRYRNYLKELAEALNDTGWDGEWYRRAYYDDGAPLGSKQSDECQIDTLAQAWAVISRAAPVRRAAKAITAMQRHLVSEDDGIIRLLTPAFDRTCHDPGYIKGYVPGVRENGGQYTHAAIWAVRALAEICDRASAAPLLEMLTPVSHTQSADRVEIYQGEPYVVAADVYGVAPHVGRAGWTWYTGSAGWMYRALLESVLGFGLQNNERIELRPCIPASWPGFTLSYRFPDGTRYTLVIEQKPELTQTSVGTIEDGAVIIPVAHDGTEHEVHIILGQDVGPRYRQRVHEMEAPLV
jgi:cyclic beta-1,2-glucan synthetase